MFSFISFKTRILLGVGLVLAMMFAMAAFSFINDIKSKENLGNIDTVTLPHALLASEMVTDIVQVQQFLTDVSATRNSAAYKEAETYAQAFKQGLAKFRQNIGHNPEELDKLAELEQDFDRFYVNGKRMAAAYISSGTEAGNQIMEEFDKASLDLVSRMNAFKQSEIDDATRHVHELTEETQTTTRLLLGFAIASVFIGLGIALYLTRYLNKQLGVDPIFAKGIAKEIAKGNFSRNIRLEPGDSKSLLHALKNMQQQLRERMEQEQSMQQQLREQMELEAKAKASALRIKMALDKTSTNVMVTDEHYNIIYLNESLDKLFHEIDRDFRRELPGFNADALIGTNIDIFHRDPSHQRALLGGLESAFKTSFVIAGRHVTVTISPVIEETGERLGLVLEWQDRTHEVKIENEIKTIVDAVKIGKLDGRLETADKSGFFQMLGANINELTTVIDNVFNDITRVMQSLASGNLNHRMANEYEGVYGQCKTNINATIDSLRERIEAEAEAKESALRIQMALDKTSTNVMMADENQRIIYINDALQALFRGARNEMQRDIPNFDADNLVGTNIDLLHRNAGFEKSSLGDILATFKSSFVVGGRNIDVAANPVLTGNGRRVGTVVEWNDRTHEIKIEDEIKAIVAAVKAGELHRRLNLSDKSGFFETLGENINALTAVIESAFTDIAKVMRGMAKGDLCQRITQNYEGVYGDCNNDINATLDTLHAVFSQIKNAAVTINQYSDEISSGNDDLSLRAEQQAASLEETASSMEELTSTVKHNADYAQQANEEAVQAKTTAEEGSEVANSAILAMLEINQSNTKIADIIGVIDEIALQTNILALNAAVEAARAGEQGRGFAVVASEVRSLAQRSAEAAKEIKILISDSTEKVEEGGKLVGKAGQSLNTIVEGVKNLNDIIAKIAFESEQQFQGIKQINLAIAQMDDITQQNAALAEQTAAASTSMKEQSSQMRELTAFFKLGDNATSANNEKLALPAPPSKPNKSKQPLLLSSPTDSGWEEF
jgi:methyl-accepting chemotaxis protein